MIKAMVPISKQDFYKIKVDGLIADYDLESLANLYQPIIGYSAVSLYLTLKSQSKMSQNNETHASLFKTLDIKPGDFVDSRKRLEGVGLLRTYRESLEDKNNYTYVLYSPKTPRGFFDDVLLYGYLIKIIGEANANKLKKSYKKEIEQEKGEEITAKFSDVFDAELNDSSYALAASSEDDAIGRAHSNIEVSFDYDVFFKEIDKISEINNKMIGKKTMSEISRIAALFGINEKAMANEVAAIFNPNKTLSMRVDIEELKKRIENSIKEPEFKASSRKSDVTLSSDSILARKIKLMEETAPINYLKVLQHGTKPLKADIRLVDDISKDLMLSNGVINVLIEYVLKKNSNILSRPYMERMAASLKREDIDNAYDAMNFLNSLASKGKKKTDTRKIENVKKPTNVINQTASSNDDEDWDNILKDL